MNVMKLSLKEKVGYSLGDTASHFVWDMVGFWLFSPLPPRISEKQERLCMPLQPTCS